MKAYTAIITGATSGIGAAFARQLAEMGYNLLLTGRRSDRLIQMKNELEKVYPIQVKYVAADLTNAKEFGELLCAVNLLQSVDLLINNAGFGNRSNFFESEYMDQQKMIDVHINATTRLTHEVVPLMLENGSGAIINVASLAAFLPARLSYFYCSSKAFLVAFSECLHVDLKHKGIKVQALCPGFTQTEFHDKEGMTGDMNWMSNQMFWMTPEQVVQYSIRSLRGHRVICIPGYFNRFIYRVVRLLPRSIYYLLSALKTETNQIPALSHAV